MQESSILTASPLTRAYLSLVRHIDGRSGPGQRFWSRFVDASLCLFRPRFRALDAPARRRVYLEIRRQVESDPRALAAHVRFLALLHGGLLTGVLMGGLVGLLAAAPGLTAEPEGSAVLLFCRFLGVFLAWLSLGTLLCGLAGGLIARKLLWRTGPSRQEWQTLVDNAFAKASDMTANDEVQPTIEAQEVER